MRTIYKHADGNGNFVAFWREDQNRFGFFRPTGFGDAIYYERVDEWDSVKQSKYRGDADLVSYPDEINAARYFLHDKNIYNVGGDEFDKRRVVVSTVEPGVYYPRIWQGCYGYGIPYNSISPAHEGLGELIKTRVAGYSLLSSVIDIFRYIEPSEDNMKSYGHKIRELIILACTEVECGLRSVLRENSEEYEGAKVRTTTRDYVKLKHPLRLGEWRLSLHDYPQLGYFSPFNSWDASESPFENVRGG